MSGSWKRKTAATEMERIGVIRDSSDTDDRTESSKPINKFWLLEQKNVFLEKKACCVLGRNRRISLNPLRRNGSEGSPEIVQNPKWNSFQNRKTDLKNLHPEYKTPLVLFHLLQK